MGREIRRVPADWVHPKDYRGEYRPLYDEDYETAARKWEADYELWRAGKHEDQHGEHKADCKYFWDWDGGPPDDERYRNRAWTQEEATHYQMYETVSEGTPVSPVFATKSELVAYLVDNGDFWDQKRGDGGWGRNAAERFVGFGYAPSGVIMAAPDGGTVFKTARDGI